MLQFFWIVLLVTLLVGAVVSIVKLLIAAGALVLVCMLVLALLRQAL